MEAALLVAAVLVAGLACPAMMWWQRRRGREASCCAPRETAGESGATVGELRRRNDALHARLAELRGEAQPLASRSAYPSADG